MKLFFIKYWLYIITVIIVVIAIFILYNSRKITSNSMIKKVNNPIKIQVASGKGESPVRNGNGYEIDTKFWLT